MLVACQRPPRGDGMACSFSSAEVKFSAERKLGELLMADFSGRPGTLCYEA